MNFSAGRVSKINELTIEFYFEKDVEIDPQLCKEIVRAIRFFSKGQYHALLFNFNGRHIILSEIARKLSGSKDYSNSKLIARAIVTQSMTSSLETSHYIQNSKPAADTGLFTSKEKAIEWLNEKALAFLKVT